MKTKVGMSCLLLALAILWGTPAICVDDPPTQLPNGFISGPHYNLNIHGKNAGFTCPAPVPGEYGKVIFIPEYGTGINIYMQSGKVGGNFQDVSELQVIDACTFGDGKATLKLPKWEKGYWVFARTLAKPGTQEDPRSIYISPAVDILQDEAGNELWFFGTLGMNGEVCTKDASGEITCSLTRSTGKSKAVDITNIFEYSGQVCYFNADDALNLPNPGTMSLCCFDSSGDGTFQQTECMGDVPTCPVPLTVLTCGGYSEAWVFNIADFVQYLWGITNDGVKLVQVRFYPIP
jgi:hypothetical protein